jgi:hypothetical protein
MWLSVLVQSILMHQIAFFTVNSQVRTIKFLSQMTARLVQLITQWNGQYFATDMDCIDMGVIVVELPANLFNKASPTSNLVFVKELPQYFVDNPQADSVPVLPTAQASPETETVSTRMNTCVPHFPILSIFGREEVTKDHATSHFANDRAAGSTPGIKAPGGLVKGRCSPEQWDLNSWY